MLIMRSLNPPPYLNGNAHRLFKGYEMVTGRVPFDGESAVAIAIQHLQEEMVNPSAYAPDLPVSLEKIILIRRPRPLVPDPRLVPPLHSKYP